MKLIQKEENKKNIKARRTRLLIYAFIYAAIMIVFYKINYLSYSKLSTVYLPILGVGMIAIIIDYMIFGQILILSTLASLFAEFIIMAKFGREGAALAKYMSSTIKIVGLVFGFLVQMYVKQKLKYKK